MNKAAGLGIGAAVLSITVGVLVGIVIHAGQVERADSPSGPAVDVLTSAWSDSSSTAGLQPPTSAWTSSIVVSSNAPSIASSNDNVSPSDDVSSSDDAPPVTGTPSPISTPGESMTTTRSSPGAATTTGAPGTDAADQPCPTLADRSADAAGTTLYCQVDQTDHTLRWRAVFDGGGCLTQTMTGIGADGISYACRLDASGRNHWAAAG